MVTYFWLRNHYRPAPLNADITLFRPIDIPVPEGSDASCGWASMTKGRILTKWIPGNRTTMFLNPNLADLGDGLRASLAEDNTAHIAARVEVPGTGRAEHVSLSDYCQC